MNNSELWEFRIYIMLLLADVNLIMFMLSDLKILWAITSFMFLCGYVIAMYNHWKS